MSSSSDAPSRRSFDEIGILIAVLILAIGIILLLVGALTTEDVWKEITHDAGLVLIGTVLVTFVYEWVLRRQHDRYVIRLVESCLISGGSEYGLKSIERRLDFQRLFHKLKSGDELLWLDTYCPDQPNYQEALRVALERGAKVRMLAVAPGSAVANYRAAEIQPGQGYSASRFSAEAQGQIDRLREVLAEVPEVIRKRVKVRLYGDLPCAPMYIHIRKGRPMIAFTSYFLRQPTFSEPHLKWGGSPDGFLGKFHDYFEAKWAAHVGDEVDLDTSLDTVERSNDGVRPTGAQPRSTDDLGEFGVACSVRRDLIVGV